MIFCGACSTAHLITAENVSRWCSRDSRRRYGRNAMDKRAAITTLLRHHPYGSESSKVKSPHQTAIV
jgi:hypothetical protein